MEAEASIKLTQFSHGAGCGCKISPAVLSEILGHDERLSDFPQLLVGNQEKDDAAVYDLDGTTSIISTTDFFMPIVDDPKDFGAIAATNAISDIYAMGGRPLMAIAILGWPLKTIELEHAHAVIEGGREACTGAGIPLAGGHSIDAPEPIFGLAVTGSVPSHQIKRNSTAKPGDLLYLTKPLGIGMVATAQKRGIASSEELATAVASMKELNSIGQEMANLSEVHAITDVTGFGLGGHLMEMCTGAGLGADVFRSQIPTFPFVERLLEAKCHPGGTERNWDSYGQHIKIHDESDKYILADPQTSGGLLLAVDSEAKEKIEDMLQGAGLYGTPIGQMTNSTEGIQVIR